MNRTRLFQGRRRTPSKHRLDPDQPGRYPLFSRVGVELEYMIVDRETLAVRPDADTLLAAVAGEHASEVEFEETAWSNELVLHVIELKTAEPRPALAGLDRRFQEDVRRIDSLLKEHGAMLLPGAMHPWMDPDRETRLWPHAQTEIYEAYDRIFGVHGHGWANVQSTHLNLPFSNEDEFVRLHAAIRLVLPLLPALAASSPLQDGRLTGLLDNRLAAYASIQQRVPSVTGRVIPEAVRSLDAYHDKILGPMYRDIAKHDPDGLLQHEWLNSRGAIARFDRSAIEIRLLDIQECPAADIAIAALVIETVKALAEERWAALRQLHRVPGALLERLFFAALRDGERVRIWNRDYLRLFGVADRESMAMGELWDQLLRAVLPPEELAREGWGVPLKAILEHGPLARRITVSLGRDPQRAAQEAAYRKLARCLLDGRMYMPPAEGPGEASSEE